MDIGVPIRELGPVNVVPLINALEGLDDEAWLVNDIRQQIYEIHRQTRSIVLIFAEGWPDIRVARFEGGWKLLAHLVLPIIEDVLRRAYPPGGHVIRAVVANLVAGGTIEEHYDAAPSFAVGHRIHVPLQTSDDVRFLIEGERHVMQVGQAYEINNLKFHEVHNEGTEDRYHLIFDYVPPRA